MPLETSTTIAGLNPNWPLGSDPKSQGDDHIRLIKSVMQADAISREELATIIQQQTYPVGALYLSATDTDPADTLGFGTWEAFAEGRAIVGAGNNGTSDWDAGDERGEETHVLTQAELAAHSHTGTATSAGAHTHTTNFRPSGSASANSPSFDITGQRANSTSPLATESAGAHTHPVTTTDTGGGAAHNNIQPSIGVYIWLRTA